MSQANLTKVNKTPSENELELEILTKEYITGKLGLGEYRRKVARIETRLDLRRIASKLKPILSRTPSDRPE